MIIHAGYQIVTRKVSLCQYLYLEEIKVFNPEDWIFNHVILDIYVVLRETTLTISDSNEIGSPVESEIMRVVFLCSTEIPK